MTDRPKILYNGACPVCRREIDHYRRIDRDHGAALDFADIGEPGPALSRPALSDDQVRRRLHVLEPDGRLLTGVPAFAAIWDRLPRYRWLARLSRLPVLRTLLPWIYEPIAFGLYHLDKRRRRRQCSAKA